MKNGAVKDDRTLQTGSDISVERRRIIGVWINMSK
jgi:hypothetical protein